MIAATDFTGQKFGQWTVLARTVAPEGRHGIYWTCRCECGTQREVLGQDLRNGRSRGCGCTRLRFLHPRGQSPESQDTAVTGAASREAPWVGDLVVSGPCDCRRGTGIDRRARGDERLLENVGSGGCELGGVCGRGHRLSAVSR